MSSARENSAIRSFAKLDSAKRDSTSWDSVTALDPAPSKRPPSQMKAPHKPLARIVFSSLLLHVHRSNVVRCAPVRPRAARLHRNEFVPENEADRDHSQRRRTNSILY